MDSPQSNDRWLPLTSSPTSPVAVMQPDPLAELKFAPKASLPLTLSTHPSASAKSISPTTPTNPSRAAQPLTPPTTPEKPADKRSSIGSGLDPSISPSGSGLKNVFTFDGEFGSKDIQAQNRPLQKVPEAPQQYSKKYYSIEKLGQGAWSNVYSAYEQTDNVTPSSMLPPSPPISPEGQARSHSAQLLAVKVPSERMAHKVLKKEASILTYLHSNRSAARSYLVPFHGFDYNTHTIVMDAIPTSLETLIKTTPRGELSTKTMFDPIIGAPTWASLAEQLIEGLAFLQSIGCIHGDIKPANVLIRSDPLTQTLTPFFCDFSSSRIQLPQSPTTTASSAPPAEGEEEAEEITAVTKDYLSPELLRLLLGRNNDRAIATPASDIFALAVTLLAAAIGGSPYAAAQMEIQKLSMAKEGVPMEFARQGANGSRCMKGRAVARILGPALERDPGGRIGVGEWGVLAREVGRGWEEGGWSRGG